MRKKVFGRKLNRNRRSRASLFRSLSKAMILHGSVKTTRAKAKAIIKELDRLMGFVADGSVAKRRDALSQLGNDRKATDMLFEKYSEFAKSRKSGFTTLSILPPRRGDSAEMLQISWVEMPKPEETKAEPKKSKEKVKKAEDKK